MKPQNILFLLSDQHSPKALGCYGSSVVRTPNLDRLAARGTRFSSAYCNSPICISARAALATGRYVHEIGYWDNGRAYEGSVPSWGHRLAFHGHDVESIGKLHFRSEEDPTGFVKQHLPMHVVGGGGDIFGIQSAVLGKPYDIPFSGKASWLYAGEAAAAFIAAVSSDGEGAPVFDLNGSCAEVDHAISLIGSLQPGAEITCSGEPFPFPADMDDEPLRRHVGGYPVISIEDGIRATHEAFVQLAHENRMPELPA